MDSTLKIILLFIAVMFLAPIILMLMDFGLKNWLIAILVIAGIVTIVFVYRYVSKGDQTAGSSFRGIP